MILRGWVFPCFFELTGNLTGNFSFFDVLKRENVRKNPVFIGAFFSLVKKITGKLIVCNREFSSKTGPVVQTNQGADHAG